MTILDIVAYFLGATLYRPIAKSLTHGHAHGNLFLSSELISPLIPCTIIPNHTSSWQRHIC